MKEFEIVIVGAGISGVSLFYLLCKYSNVKSIALIEQYANVAAVNSNSNNNSQTLHRGDIESNYDYEKAAKLKQNSNMIVNYAKNLESLGDVNDFVFKGPRMLLGVGCKEIEAVTKRAKKLAKLYPDAKLLDYKDIAKQEPFVVSDKKSKGYMRKDIIAFATLDDYSIVNYSKMAVSLVQQAEIAAKKRGVKAEILLNTEVLTVDKQNSKYQLSLRNTNSNSTDNILADFISFTAGAKGLLYAHKLNLLENFLVLPVAGSFYLSKKKVLNGKVYCLQKAKLPFAAVHGDFDIDRQNLTRFGPTALIIPKFDRYKKGGFNDFIKGLNFDSLALRSLVALFLDKDLRGFALRNLLYLIPFIHKKAFLKQVKKIIPDMCLKDLFFANNVGGVRPQLIDKNSRKLFFSKGSFFFKEQRVLFNISPPTGGSSSFANSYADAKNITSALNLTFDTETINKQYITKN